MKKFIFFFFSTVFGVSLFIFVLKRVGWSEIWAALNILSWWQFFLVTSVLVVGFLLCIWRWKIILKSQGYSKIPLTVLLRSKIVGFTLSYLTPSIYFGGEPLRALMLKEENGLDWEANITSIIIDKVLELTINGLIILTGLIYILTYFTLPSWLSWLLIGILFFCLGLAYFFYSRTIKKRGFFTSIINFFNLHQIEKIKGIQSNLQTIEKYLANFFSHQPRYLMTGLSLSLVGRGLSIVGAWLIIHFLGVEIGLITLLVFMALLYAVFFIPIPGSLGSQEASQALVFALFGLGAHTGIAWILILRAIHLIGVAIGLLVLTHFQIKIWGRKIVGWLERLGKIMTNGWNNFKNN